MERMVVRSKVGADGILHLHVPVGTPDANREVEVTIEPLPQSSGRLMTQEQWADFVRKTAGSITDSTFQRHEQGEYERREAFP